MKIAQLLISLLLWRASTSPLTFAAAQEDHMVDAPSEQQVEEPSDEIPAPNCDEVCSERLAAAASIANVDKENLWAQINNLQEALRRAEQQLADANREKDDVASRLQRDIEGVSASRRECDDTVGSLRHQIAQIKSSLASSSEESAKLAGDLFLVNQDLAIYQEKIFHVNSDLLLAEIKKVIDFIKAKVNLLLSKTGIKK
ncbi:unnamed protein product [Cylindrotheca closterium]|uniref:Biogenesis of lysosome-related organelles complex 1 subunit 1 n=1 Tax=Cylindrotheca closterium TaxID=2856 RepID=A0AAD2CPV4_9STRA|nr:unnamed protein product [Cylindrotheca closterium]